MASTQDQEQVIATANFARQAVAELLATTLSAANGAENVELKFRTIHAGREVALQVKGRDFEGNELEWFGLGEGR